MMSDLISQLIEECYAPFMCIIIMVCFLAGNRKKYHQNVIRYFMLLAGLMFVECVGSSAERYFHTVSMPTIRLFLSWLCYLTGPAIILTIAETMLRDQPKWVKWTVAVPEFVNILVTTTSFFSSWCISITATNLFHVGPLGFVPRYMPLIYILILMVTGFINIRKSPWECVIVLGGSAFVILNFVNEIFFKGENLRETTISFAILAYLMYFTAIQHIDEVDEIEEIHHENEERLTKDMVDQCIETLAYSIDAKDRYTKGHSSRVAHYSRKIAQVNGKDEDFCRQVYLAGLLHDIGKLSISNTIINKPGRLTDDEYAKIKHHPERGAMILEKMKSLPFLQDGAKYHHERYDGKGYPYGLQGEEIPELARIIAVADSYDAMTSYRSYRPTMDQVLVKQEMWRGMGTQFDPLYAKIMISLIDGDTNYELREKPDEDYDIVLGDELEKKVWPSEDPKSISEIERKMINTYYNTLGAHTLSGGDWSHPTDGVKVDTSAVEVGFTGTMIKEVSFVWCAPVVIVFSSADGKIHGPDYDELAVFNGAGYGWSAGTARYEYSGFTRNEGFIDWDNWVESNKAGLSYTVSAHRENDMVELTMENELITVDAHVALQENYDKQIYIALTGERCEISNVHVNR